MKGSMRVVFYSFLLRLPVWIYKGNHMYSTVAQNESQISAIFLKEIILQKIFVYASLMRLLSITLVPDKYAIAVIIRENLPSMFFFPDFLILKVFFPIKTNFAYYFDTFEKYILFRL